MIIIHNRLIPFKKYEAINLFGILFCRKHARITPEVILHERIHTRQMWELLIVGFYLWYVVEWLVRLPMKGRAYSNISMEREAYANMHDANYLRHRKPYAWMRYLRNVNAR